MLLEDILFFLTSSLKGAFFIEHFSLYLFLGLACEWWCPSPLLSSPITIPNSFESVNHSLLDEQSFSVTSGLSQISIQGPSAPKSSTLQLGYFALSRKYVWASLMGIPRNNLPPSSKGWQAQCSINLGRFQTSQL